MNKNKLFAAEMFFVGVYVLLILSVLCSLGILNKEMKTVIFKMYGVSDGRK